MTKAIKVTSPPVRGSSGLLLYVRTAYRTDLSVGRKRVSRDMDTHNTQTRTTTTTPVSKATKDTCGRLSQPTTHMSPSSLNAQCVDTSPQALPRGSSGADKCRFAFSATELFQFRRDVM